MHASPVVDLSNSFGAAFIGLVVCVASVLSSAPLQSPIDFDFIVSSGWRLRKREFQ